MTATLAPPAAAGTVVGNCVASAVIATFERLCGSSPTLVEPSADLHEGPQIIGIISFVGETSWTLSWGLGEQTAVGLTRAFTGLDLEFSSADMGDVAAELVNVLAGDVVAQASQAGLQVQMSLPAVARGQAIEFIVDQASRASQLSFRSDLGDFWVGIRTQSSGLKMPGR